MPFLAQSLERNYANQQPCALVRRCFATRPLRMLSIYCLKKRIRDQSRSMNTGGIGFGRVPQYHPFTCDYHKVILLSNSTGICVQGHPFMESLLDNKALLYSLLASGGFVVCMVTGSVPEINQQFEIVTFPPKVIPLLTRMRSD